MEVTGSLGTPLGLVFVSHLYVFFGAKEFRMGQWAPQVGQGWVSSRGTMRNSWSLSCGARLVRSPCAWRGGSIIERVGLDLTDVPDHSSPSAILSLGRFRVGTSFASATERDLLMRGQSSSRWGEWKSDNLD